MIYGTIVSGPDLYYASKGRRTPTGGGWAIWRTKAGWWVEESGRSPVGFSEKFTDEIRQNHAMITPQGGVATAWGLDWLVRNGKPLMGQDLGYPGEELIPGGLT